MHGLECKGMDRPEFRCNFSYLCSLEKLDLFCVVETKISMAKTPVRIFGKYFDHFFFFT